MGQHFFTAERLQGRLERYARPGVPKYVAMRDAVVSAVTDGEWPPGTRLPTESEWAAALPLSLGTIQRALRLLVDDGVIVRRHGAGSFVAERNLGRMHAPLHCRFLDDSGGDYLPVYPKVLSRYEVRQAGAWSRHLGTEALLCIERALLIGSEFTVFSRFYADPARLPALANLPLRKLSGENFKDVIWRESQQPIGRINQFLCTVDLPAEVCEVIGARRDTVGQLLEAAAFVGRDSPIYYQELFIPPNRRRLHLAGDGKDPGIKS
jgi:DNA-binding GntR family transcriptional regulator